MGKPKKKQLPDLCALAQPGAEIAVRVTPKASRNALEDSGAGLRAYVTVVPEGGKANKAVQALLAMALNIPACACPWSDRAGQGLSRLMIHRRYDQPSSGRS